VFFRGQIIAIFAGGDGLNCGEAENEGLTLDILRGNLEPVQEYTGLARVEFR
jgi:hypothetical protein